MILRFQVLMKRDFYKNILKKSGKNTGTSTIRELKEELQQAASEHNKMKQQRDLNQEAHREM